MAEALGRRAALCRFAACDTRHADDLGSSSSRDRWTAVARRISRFPVLNSFLFLGIPKPTFPNIGKNGAVDLDLHSGILRMEQLVSSLGKFARMGGEPFAYLDRVFRIPVVLSGADAEF